MILITSHQAPPVKPGELLPSVLRTSADLGSGPGKLPLAAGDFRDVEVS